MFLPAGTSALTLRRIEDPPAASTRFAVWSRTYHALVVGEALLARGADGRWTASVSTDGRLLPLPTAPGTASPMTRRALALFAPADVGRPPVPAAGDAVIRRPDAEFYGWSLLYQPPDMRGHALVDAHEAFADLPAFFESGAELVDRTEHLAARGIAVRPLALLARPDDYTVSVDGRLCNRFVPRAERNAGRRDG